MKKIMYKEENGIVLADAIIAVFILTVFTGLVTNLLYNIYINSVFVKRNSTASGYAVQIIEDAKIVDYSEVKLLENDSILKDKIDTDINSVGTATDNNNPLNNTYEYKWIKEGYEIIVRIENYYPEDDNSQYDFVKQISVTINYTIGKTEKKLEIKTMIGK